MNDRELLELAAKAAGIEVKYFDAMSGGAFLGDGRGVEWNPLTDDGDALRLAVKLRMDIEIRVCAGYVSVAAYREPDSRVYVLEKPGDSAESLRRAITRAAAEIGARITTEDGK
ncbi:hypothetical protein [Burkholderia gladioli]|uniref:Phage ABA sandwich domain-containing protein n=1 Tax=Burkholderia gladioli TaxID=28095 RepID=A0AB38U5S6_BURGA|nr:hypothetical protein [Burkholderia gladioli]UWX75326.1 hypothetical protein NYZ96_35175 [Burkholderia gladioli]